MSHSRRGRRSSRRGRSSMTKAQLRAYFANAKKISGPRSSRSRRRRKVVVRKKAIVKRPTTVKPVEVKKVAGVVRPVAVPKPKPAKVVVVAPKDGELFYKLVVGRFVCC